MNSRAILLAELEEKRHKNKELGVNMGEPEGTEPRPGEGYDPYDNPGTQKTSRFEGRALRRYMRRP